jgi:hypothetical protein
MSVFAFMPPWDRRSCDPVSKRRRSDVLWFLIKDPQSAHGQIIDDDAPEAQPVNGHPPDHETSDRKRADR